MRRLRLEIVRSLTNLARVVAWASLMYLGTVFLGFLVSILLPRIEDAAALTPGCYWMDGIVPRVACTGVPLSDALSAVLSQWLTMLYLPALEPAGMAVVTALLLWSPAVYLIVYAMTHVLKAR